MPAAMTEVGPREKFKKVAGNMVLPAFVIRDPQDGWRLVSYEEDILSRINWKDATSRRCTSSR